MTKKSKTPMNQKAAERIKNAAKDNPGNKTAQDDFSTRAQDAALKNQKGESK